MPNRGLVLGMDPDAFSSFIRPTLDSILLLRDAALSDGLRSSERDLAALRVRFALSLVLVLLTFSAAAAATWWFDRRIVRPTRLITTTILALADGARDVPVPMRDRSDELGQMAKAIETLRRNAIEAEAIGRAMLELQQARAEEKAALLRELTRSNGELTALNLELESLAATDALTGVPNRRSFNLALAREWRRAEREEIQLAFALLDIDCFKAFNDRYGHQAGDACLARVAAAVVHAVRRPGDIVARYGGEEFAVILPATDLDGGLVVAECIRNQVAAMQVPHADGLCGIVTVSVGVAALIPGQAESSDDLLRLADAALYAAKRAGRDRVMASPCANAYAGRKVNGATDPAYRQIASTVSNEVAQG